MYVHDCKKNAPGFLAETEFLTLGGRAGAEAASAIMVSHPNTIATNFVLPLRFQARPRTGKKDYSRRRFRWL